MTTYLSIANILIITFVIILVIINVICVVFVDVNHIFLSQTISTMTDTKITSSEFGPLSLLIKSHSFIYHYHVCSY